MQILFLPQGSQSPEFNSGSAKDAMMLNYLIFT